jgi:pSer/pThr/pTyr-binding forkhead associated (FHA) protein
MEPGSGEAHELTGTRVYVGRAPEAGVRIADTTVSRVHAVLRVDGEKVIVEDAASTNGVFVNGLRVRAAVLNDFDTVAFGNVGYLFRLGPAAEEAALRGQ